jgi:hypothetical protein
MIRVVVLVLVLLLLLAFLSCYRAALITEIVWF